MGVAFSCEFWGEIEWLECPLHLVHDKFRNFHCNPLVFSTKTMNWLWKIGAASVDRDLSFSFKISLSWCQIYQSYFIISDLRQIFKWVLLFHVYFEVKLNDWNVPYTFYMQGKFRNFHCTSLVFSVEAVKWLWKTVVPFLEIDLSFLFNVSLSWCQIFQSYFIIRDLRQILKWVPLFPMCFEVKLNDWNVLYILYMVNFEISIVLPWFLVLKL